MKVMTFVLPIIPACLLTGVLLNIKADEAVIITDSSQICDIDKPILVNESFGTITSSLDAMTGHYYANRSCLWLITAAPSKVINFRFIHLDLEACSYFPILPALSFLAMCSCDFVSIYNGNDKELSPLITKQCGKIIPDKVYTTSGNYALVKFITDGDHEWNGFSLEFEAIDKDDIPCKLVNVISGRQSGIIKSHVCNKTGAYRQDENCKWQIEVDSNHLIRFTFLFYNIRECRSCDCDSVAIYDGPAGGFTFTFYPKLVAKRCGSNKGLNESFITAGSVALVHFKTGEQSNMTNAGFILHFQEESLVDNTPCRGTISILATKSGQITNFRRLVDGKYRAGEECRWTIRTTEEGMFIRLKFLSLDVPRCDTRRAKCSCGSVSIYKGENYVDTICGTNLSPKTDEFVYLAESVITVHFTTNEDDPKGTGFIFSYEVVSPDHLPCESPNVQNVDAYKTLPVISPRRKNGLYRANETCDWKLSVSKGYILKVRVKFLDLDECPHKDCGSCDSVAIYDGAEPLKLLCGKLNCSGSIEEKEDCWVQKMTGDNCHIRFRTNSSLSKTGTGFELEAFAIAKNPGGDGTLEPKINDNKSENKPAVTYDPTVLITAVAALVCVVAFLVIAGIYWRSSQRKNRRGTSASLGGRSELERYITLSGSFSSIVAEYGTEEIGMMLDRLNIESNNLTIGTRIGEGNFGIVYNGTLKTSSEGESKEQEVAVKAVKSGGSESVIEFLKEALIMQNMDHQNVLRLIGICIIEEQPHMVFPFMKNGSLRAYLQEIGEQIPETTLSHFCLQICRGMNYLTKQNCIHRDLAARNVLVDVEGVLKIADFGLAREIQNNSSYYWSSSNHRPMPLRWHPPESILQRTFEEKSDVWSFGVVCWEVFSKCQTEPYSGMTNDEVVDFLCNQNQRLPKPDCCPEEIYTGVMLKCWTTDRKERPSFYELLPVLKSHNMEILETC